MKIRAEEFLQVVRPPLSEGDAAGLAEAVCRKWRPREICQLLRYPDADVRRVAAVTLGLVGDGSCIACLARALHDEDEQVNQMAEHGLWSVWFRSGNANAARPFHEGVALLSTESYEEAVEQFDTATRADPDFAEAYNQRGIARFLMGCWQESLEDSQHAAHLMPMHFGAISGMGHCYAHLGQMDKALACYRRAIEIHPRMPAIARAVERLEQKLEGGPGTPGSISSLRGDERRE